MAEINDVAAGSHAVMAPEAMITYAAIWQCRADLIFLRYTNRPFRAGANSGSMSASPRDVASVYNAGVSPQAGPIYRE